MERRTLAKARADLQKRIHENASMGFDEYLGLICLDCINQVIQDDARHQAAVEFGAAVAHQAKGGAYE